MRKTLVHPVADGPVVVQRSKDLADFVQHIVDTDHIEESFLLAGKRGVGQVFGGCRGAHCKRGLGIAALQAGKSLANGLLQGGWERLHLHHGTDLGAGDGQSAHIFGI